MCGILAIHKAGGGDTLARAENGIRALQHRGPDGSRTWQSQDRSVSLAHSRLAINDVSTGGQPISNEDGSIVVVVNGEFYDLELLRARLVHLGHHFRTESDSEIVVHSYEQFGIGALEQLQGEFAFVLWDDRRHLLWAVRDRFGVKPLYYAESGDEIVFSSEVRGLKQAGIELAWDPEGFFEQFIFQTGLAGRTLYRGVSELPAGCFLVRHGLTSRIQQYWDLTYPNPEVASGGVTSAEADDAYADRLLDLLNQAVRSRLHTDLRAACYLSGGLDSTSICALLQRNAGYRVQAFSVSFDDPDYDEWPQAEQSATELGIGLTKVPISQAVLTGNFSKAVSHCEGLITNANAVAKFCLSRSVREAGYRIVLTGEGADELFAGYPNFLVDYIRHGSIAEQKALQRQLGKTDEEMRAAPLSRWSPFLASTNLRPGLRSGVDGNSTLDPQGVRAQLPRTRSSIRRGGAACPLLGLRKFTKERLRFAAQPLYSEQDCASWRHAFILGGPGGDGTFRGRSRTVLRSPGGRLRPPAPVFDEDPRRSRKVASSKGDAGPHSCRSAAAGVNGGFSRPRH